MEGRKDVALKTVRQVKQKNRRVDRISLTVNGQLCELEVGSRPDQVEAWHTLAHTLRETLGRNGRNYIVEHLSREQTARLYTTVLEKVAVHWKQ